MRGGECKFMAPTINWNRKFWSSRTSGLEVGQRLTMDYPYYHKTDKYFETKEQASDKIGLW